MQQPNTGYKIINATSSHIPQITAIVNHYIAHTATNFSYRDLPESHYGATLSDNRSRRRLPFLVAIENPPSNDDDDTTENSDDKVIGFTTVTPWVPSKLGYAHTLEVSLYISPTQRGGGIGTVLLTTLINHLESNEYLTFSECGAKPISGTASLNPTTPDVSSIPGIPVKCTQLLALMAVDEDATLDERVWRFYERQGFEVMGVLKRVGWKFGKRRDVRMLAKELNVGYTPEETE